MGLFAVALILFCCISNASEMNEEPNMAVGKGVVSSNYRFRGMSQLQKPPFTMINTRAVCMQIDLKFAGGVLELNFAVMGEVSLTGTDQVTASLTVGGGLTLGALFLKSSFYVSGKISLEFTYPQATKAPMAALKWSLLKWANENKEKSAFAKVINKLGGSKGIKKMAKMSADVRAGLKTASAEEIKQGEKGGFIVDDKKFNLILEDGHKKFVELMDKFRTAGPSTLKAMQGKKDEAGKQLVFQDEFEKVWRGTYVNDPTVRGTGLTDKRPVCSKIAKATPFQPLMCTFFKYGLLTANNDPSKGNANTKAMFKVAYPELFLAKAADIEKLLATMNTRTTAYQDAIKKAKDKKDKEQTERRTMRLHNKLTSKLLITDMFAAGINPLIAVEPKQLEKLLTEFVAAAKEDKCEATCACGITTIELEGNMGITVGSSAVGFCTPDTNPVQFVSAIKRSWAKEKKGKKCGLVWQDYDGYSLMFTLAGSSYLALDWTWNFNDANKLLGRELQLRFRIPVQFDPPEPDTTPKNLIDAFVKVFTGDKTLEDIQGFGSKNIENSISGFFEKIFGVIKSTKGVGSFFDKLTAGAGGAIGKTTMKDWVTGLLKKWKDPKMKLADLPVATGKTGLMGFDISYNFQTKKAVFAFDNLKIESASVAFPSGSGMTVGVGGYCLAGSRFEFKT